MTRRDMTWRGAGVVLMVSSYVAAQLEIGGSTAAIGYFVAAVAALVLMINGRHVPTALRAERRGHSRTAGAIHTARFHRRGSEPGQDRS